MCLYHNYIFTSLKYLSLNKYQINSRCLSKDYLGEMEQQLNLDLPKKNILN